MIYTPAPVPWWSPVNYHVDYLRDYSLRPIEEFPFVKLLDIRILFVGDENQCLRPNILGSEIEAFTPVFFANSKLKIHSSVGGMWMNPPNNTKFALHVEWWWDRLKEYDRYGNKWESFATDHWVENCYFERDPESEAWISLNPTEEELEIIRRWAVIAELAV